MSQMELSRDPSNSNISCEDGRAIEVENITYLNHHLYKAAIHGNAQVLDDDYNGVPFNCLLTPDQNTVLHVHLGDCQKYYLRRFSFINPLIGNTGRSISTSFVEQILNKCPSLLLKPNAKGEIPLHIAAKFGHVAAVKLLIERAKSEPHEHEDLVENGIGPGIHMLRTRNKEGNTALHEAVRFGHGDVVHALLQEEPHGLSYFSINNIGESPLYIAARKGYHSLVTAILDKCESAHHDGPRGRTALHAAVMNGDIRCTSEILSKKTNLTIAGDENEQTPLHYASHLGHRSIVKILLKCDERAAYKTDKDHMTALHIAAREGRLLIMWEFIDSCPGCFEIVDKRGWNFFHFAIVPFPVPVIIRFLRIGSCKKFLDEKDIYGNTPSQVRSVSFLRTRSFVPSSILTMENHQVEQISKLLEEVGSGRVGGVPVRHPVWLRVDKKDFDKVRDFNKVRDTTSVVLALIATAAFAAALALPGGYKSDQSDDQYRGTAILSHQAAFQAFVVADTVALISSLMALNLNAVSANPYAAFLMGENIEFFMFHAVVLLYHIAEGALLVAFMAAIHAVLQPSNIALAIATSVIISFTTISFFLWLVLKPIGVF